MSKSKNELSHLVATTHEELIAELPKLERLTQGERLKHNRKRRDKQLKKFKDLEEKNFRGSSVRSTSKKEKPNSSAEKKEFILKNVDFIFQAKLFDSCKRNAKEVRALIDDLKEAEQKDMIGSINHFGMTALHKCVALAKPTIAKELISRGANLNIGDSDSWTPLHAASFIGDCGMVKLFVESGADIIMMNLDQQTCLDLCESAEVIEYLKGKFLERNISDDMVCQLKSEPSLRMLEEMKKAYESEGRDFIDRRYENNSTLLHIAAANGYLDCLDFLLSIGADTDASDSDGWTALHTAVHWEQEKIVIKLITANANVNILTGHGETALELCPTRELRESFENLLSEHSQDASLAVTAPPSIRTRELRTSSMARTLSLNQQSSSLPKDVLDTSKVLTAELGFVENDTEEEIFLTFFHLNVDVSDAYLKQVYGDSYEPKKITASDSQVRSLYSLQKLSTIFSTSTLTNQQEHRCSLPDNFLFSKTSSGGSSGNTPTQGAADFLTPKVSDSNGITETGNYNANNSEVNITNELPKEPNESEISNIEDNTDKQVEDSEVKLHELGTSLPIIDSSLKDSTVDQDNQPSRGRTAAGRNKPGTSISGTRRTKSNQQESIGARLERVSCSIS